MKVCVSVPGRFHGFDLARELTLGGVLDCLITSYPVYKVEQFGIDKNRVKSIIGKEIVLRSWHKIFGRFPNWFWLNQWFDYQASKTIPYDSDIYILWAGFSLQTIRVIRRKNPGAIVILERGSAHIDEQRNLLKLVNQDDTILNEVVEQELLEYNETDFISVPGRFVSRTFSDRGIKNEKLFVSNYGVDLSLFSTSQHKHVNEIFTVGYCGSISKQKNVDGIIRSIEELIKNGCQIRLLIAGVVDTQSYPSNYLSRYNFITYLGSLPQSQLPVAYSQMDVFVLNSVQDGFGMVLLQAMAMGVPPIATVNSGGLDVITNGVNGFLIPILDDDSLKKQIKFLYENFEIRQSIGAMARETVRDGFSWKDYGDRYISFLKTKVKY